MGTRFVKKRIGTWEEMMYTSLYPKTSLETKTRSFEARNDPERPKTDTAHGKAMSLARWAVSESGGVTDWHLEPGFIENQPNSPEAAPQSPIQTPPVPQDESEPMFVQPHDPDYVPWPMYPEYIPVEEEHILLAEEQPLPPVVSPNDGDDDDGFSSGDDADDEEEDEEEGDEEEEHLAPADSAIVIPTDELVSLPEGTGPAEVERLLAMPTPSPSPLTSLSPPSTGERMARLASTQALIDAVTAAIPSPLLPPPLYIPPPVGRRDDIPDIEMPPRKRLCLSTLGSRYKIGESSTARPTGDRGIDYGFVSTLDAEARRRGIREVGTLDAEARRRGIREVGYGIRDTWVDPTKTVYEIAPMTMGEVSTRVKELVELHEHDTHDLYALLEDAQDSRTRISQRVTMDSQRMVETLRVMGDMTREMGDMQAELLALREQPRRARQPGGDARGIIPASIALDLLRIMAPVTRQGPNVPPNNANPNNMTPESVQAMIDQAFLRNSTNRDESHSSHKDNQRNMQTTRPCFYADFMKCQPLNFKGTEGVVGLTRWIEKMESVFQINGCAIENQKMTDKYCPHGEIKKLEIELWNLKVKGNDVPAYTERFQELTLIYTKYVANETEKIDKYVSGLPNKIYESVKASKPKTLDETIELANDLMDQKLRTYVERKTNNKRKADESSSNANVANAQRNNGANPKGNGYFECGAPGHFKRDCPKLKNKDGGNANAQGWVYAIGNAERKGNTSRDPDSNVIMGTFLLNNRYASILFDNDVDRSFISTAFSSLIDIIPTPLGNSYDVKLADGKIVGVDTIMRGCTLNFLNHPFSIDLMPVELGSFDVIIGMDWLRRCHAVIMFISCSKAQEYMAKGCQIFLAQIFAKKEEDKSEGKQLKVVPVIRDFPEVFPEDLPGLPPARLVEFQIDLILGDAPVARAPLASRAKVYREPAVMSSASSTVTYTSVYTDSEPGRVFWGADEELSDRGSSRVIVYGYDGIPMLPVAPPSPDYIPGPEEPRTPPAPQDEDEHEPMFIQPHDPDFVPEPIYPEYIPLEDEHILPAEEQPLPHVVSYTAESPGYVAEWIQKKIQRSMRMMRQRMVRLTIPWTEEMMMTAVHLEMTLTIRMRRRRRGGGEALSSD
uniref:CCHC-type domain-containing protein n=1 Tax=Tanacetum cinerariifolium TaxID=118510 RepID=A0A6L2N7C0_TANCI|nr:hypothetical protein [Tanacetum cinerariifolium]